MDKGDCPRYRNLDRFKATGRLGDPSGRTKPKVSRYVSYSNLKKNLKQAPEKTIQKKRPNATNKKLASKIANNTSGTCQCNNRQSPVVHQIQASGGMLKNIPPKPENQENMVGKTGFNYSGFLSYQTQQHADMAKNPFCKQCQNINPGSNQDMTKPAIGYKIVISNIQPTVTQQDIKELFEDIGPIYSAKFLQPGVVEIMYKRIEDAQTAIRTYNNVNFDGHPMRCVIINKKASNMVQNVPQSTMSVPQNGPRPFARSLKCGKV